MQIKYLDKYRSEPMRAQWWDYRNCSAYFVTIGTIGREQFFGEIENQEVRLSEVGRIVESCWLEIPQHFPFVALGEFVVMPDHVHGIVIIKERVESLDAVESMHAVKSMHAVESMHASTVLGDDAEQGENRINDLGAIDPKGAVLHQSIASKDLHMAGISPKKGSLSSIIRSYKSAVTKRANELGLPNGWKSKYHDMIIRNEEHYLNVARYIENNPRNWGKSKSK